MHVGKLFGLFLMLGLAAGSASDKKGADDQTPRVTVEVRVAIPSTADIEARRLNTFGELSSTNSTVTLIDPYLKSVLTALFDLEEVPLWFFKRRIVLTGMQTQIGPTDAGDGGHLNRGSIAEDIIPKIDVTPYVSADGLTIQLSVVPTFIDSPVDLVNDEATPVDGLKIQVPQSRKVRETVTATVRDGVTMVIVRQSRSTPSRRILIFVTPTIIGPPTKQLNDSDEPPVTPETVSTRPDEE